MRFRLGFVEKKIVRKRTTPLVVIAVALMVVLIMGALNAFAEERDPHIYDFSFNPDMIYIGDELHFVVIGADTGFLPPARTEPRFRPFLLEGEDYAVVMLIPWLNWREVDLSSGVVRVRRDEGFAGLQNEILDYMYWGRGTRVPLALERLYNEGVPIYIRMYMTQQEPGLGERLWIAYLANHWNQFITVALLLAVFLSLIYLNPLHKRSKIGRRITALGGYDDIVSRVNEQAENAIFSKDGIWVLKDFLILNQSDFAIVPIEKIASVDSEPDEDFPDEKFHIAIQYNNMTYQFELYDQDSENQVIGYIRSKMFY